MSGSILDVAVIGAGFSGISASYYLKHFDLEHMVFERGRVGETWRSQHWDSFTLPLPNRMTLLPATPYAPKDLDGFSTLSDFISGMEHYATRFQLPISENSEVLRVEKSDEFPYYEITVYHENDGERKYRSWRILMAAGTFGYPKIPPFADQVPREVRQIHSSEYRRPSMLPEGAILVVGNGQSGCEIAEELLAAGRAVYLSTDKVPRFPRRYRGKDIFCWLTEMNLLDTGQLQTGGIDPVVSGAGEGGHAISLQGLAAAGAELLGRMEGMRGTVAYFDNSTAENIRFADQFENSLLRMIDEYITKKRIVAPFDDVEEEEIESPKPRANFDTPGLTLDMMERNIGSVIWATGTTGDFRPVGAAAVNPQGHPIHHEGVSPLEGLYFLGYPGMRTPKSNYLFGIKDDAAFVCNAIYTSIR